MNPDILGALIVAFSGLIIAFINYRISLYILTKMPNKYSFATIIRQVIQITFIVGVYFIGEALELNIIYLLIAAALGTTMPMFLFTKKLLKFNSKSNKKQTEKEDDTNG